MLILIIALVLVNLLKTVTITPHINSPLCYPDKSMHVTVTLDIGNLQSMGCQYVQRWQN